jgi:DNA-binding transcriptional regulator/RsmH inhibitor MraZ
MRQQIPKNFKASIARRNFEMLCELFTGNCLFVYHLLDLPMTMKMLQQIVLLSHVPAPNIGQSP